jgi:rhamnosyltransferase
MISAIIPTLNAGENIDELLTSLENQSIHCEIIVIDSSSSDRTLEIAASHNVKTITINRQDFDHGGTRNLAASHAKGDILAFFTQDALPENRYCLENLIGYLQNSEIAATYGRQIPNTDAKLTEKFARLFNYPDTPLIKSKDDIQSLGIKTFFFSNVCSAIRKKVFEESGGFTEKLIMNEDMLFACRIILKGYKIAYVPEARIFHSHNYTLSQQFKRYFDIGVFLKNSLQPLVHTKTEKTGVRFLREELAYCMQNSAYLSLPYVLGDAIVKYCGYKLGLNFNSIPNTLRKKMSMHRNFWG